MAEGKMVEGELEEVYDRQKKLIVLTEASRQEMLRGRRGPLPFRFFKDYDVAQPELQGLVVLRMFASVRGVVDHRPQLLRMEVITRGGETRTVAVYRGCINIDAPRNQDIDWGKVFYAGTAAQKEETELRLRQQARWDQNKDHVSGRSPAHPALDAEPLTQGLSIPADVVARIKALPQTPPGELEAAEAELRPFVESVPKRPQGGNSITRLAELAELFRGI